MIMGTHMAQAVKALLQCSAESRTSVIELLQGAKEQTEAMIQLENQPAAVAELALSLGLDPAALTPANFNRARDHLHAITAAIELLNAVQQ